MFISFSANSLKISRIPILMNIFRTELHSAKNQKMGTCRLENSLLKVEIRGKPRGPFGELKQAGTGPSRRHIQGSKIAKRLPSVKYSFTVLENRNFLKKNFSKKLHTQKNGPSGALKSHNAEKLKGWTL